MPRHFRCMPCRLALGRSGDGGADAHELSSTVVGIDETTSNVISLPSRERNAAAGCVRPRRAA
jgi:hypothetical protein